MTLSLQTLLPYFVFLVITMGVWAVLTAFADHGKGAAEDRLRRMMNPTTGRKELEDQASRRQERIQAQMAKAATRLGQSLRPSDEVELGKVRVTLLNAGFRNENAVAVLYGAKLFLMLLGLTIAFPIMA